MSEHRLHSYNFSKSFIKQGIHHNEKFLSSLEIHQLFCLNASHIYKTTLCVWFCQCVQWSYKTKYEKWQNFPGKYTNCTFSASVWSWKGQGHPKLVWTDKAQSKLLSFKFEKPVNLQLWSWKFFNVQVCETDGQTLIITQTPVNHASHKKRKKERKERKIKKSIKRNHEKPIKMPLGC